MEINEFRYAVIGRWTELDGREEWDIIHNGPLTYDESLKIAVEAGKTWEKNACDEYKKISHREIPIRYEKLQSMLEEEHR